jgi:class 3 adenylate cyclase
VPANIRLLEAVLVPGGYETVAAKSGEQALALIAEQLPDLILLDVQMPGMNGYEVCRRIRSDPEIQFLPVIMVTSSEGEDRVAAIDAGADDFIEKPLNRQELLARVRSLIRVKRYHDTVSAQARELRALNDELESRVAGQVAEIEDLNRLRRFLSPPLAKLVTSGDQNALLESHRREIAVLFADLRGWTAFSETTEPEEVMGVIREFHDTMGAILSKFEATVGWLAGDGVMAWFNDPFPSDVPAGRAAAMAVSMRDAMAKRTETWRRRGHQLDFAIGISLGYATIGMVGFEGRYEYGAVGTVMNLASRLSDEAEASQILMSARAFSSAEDQVEGERVSDLRLKGFAKPVAAYAVRRLKAEPRARPPAGSGRRTTGAT